MECSFRLMVFSLFQEDLPFNTPWWALQCVNRRLCIREAPESLAFSLQSRAALCTVGRATAAEPELCMRHG